MYLYTGSMSKLERYRSFTMKIIAFVVTWFIVGIATFILSGLDISVGSLTTNDIFKIYSIWCLTTPIVTVIALVPYGFLYGR